jgi:hypothetical protein
VLAAALGQWEPPPHPAPPPVAGATTTTTVPYNALEAEYPLLYTGPVVEGLLYAAETKVTAVTLTRPGRVMGTATAVWAGSRRSVPVVATADASLLGMPGQRIEAVLAPASDSRRGTGRAQVGSVRFTLGTETVVVPVDRRRALVLPDWMWRLVHG